MLRAYEIPLTPEPQRFSVQLGGLTYIVRFLWCPPAACWMFDLADALGNMLVNSIPVVTGLDMLAQHTHLGIQGALITQTDYQPDLIPGFDSFGDTGRLYFIATT